MTQPRRRIWQNSRENNVVIESFIGRLDISSVTSAGISLTKLRVEENEIFSPSGNSLVN